MFSRQHYVAIAAIIKSNTAITEDIEAQISNLSYTRAIRDAGVYIAKDLADYFAEDNPLFDRQKFLTACGQNNN